jgi:hypothetical protein
LFNLFFVLERATKKQIVSKTTKPSHPLFLSARAFGNTALFLPQALPPEQANALCERGR